jgi:hypothetical protein
MAAKLGGTFLIGAMGPVNYAGGCILSSRVADGLRELTPDSLFGGFQRGVAASAKRVGVSPREVERLLPMAEIQATVQRLTVSQQNAVNAWNLYAGQIGGLLKGVADLTADGRAPDVQLCLERLAKKLVRDKPLSEPIFALSVDVGAWVDLVHRCRDVLDDGAALERAYRRRRAIRIALAGSGALVFLVVLGGLGWVIAGRAAINAALAEADPCAVDRLSSNDLLRGSSDQAERVAERSKACKDARLEEEQAREAQKRKEEQAREEERKRLEHEAACAALASHVEAGALGGDDAKTAGGSLPLLKRIAARSLDPADIGPKDPVLPCGDTPSRGALERAFGKAVMAVPASWARAEEPSAAVTKLLGEHSAELPSSLKQVVAKRADTAAKKALLVGTPLLVSRGMKQCALKSALGLSGGAYCASVTATYGKAP